MLTDASLPSGTVLVPGCGSGYDLVRIAESGRKALYVSPGFTVAIEGLAEAESAALLKELIGYATAHEVIYRHVWKPHDAVMWDNRCLMHHATTYDPKYTRHMHRTTIAGTKPF